MFTIRCRSISFYQSNHVVSNSLNPFLANDMLQGTTTNQTIAVNLDRDLLRSNALVETWAISLKAKPLALLHALTRSVSGRQPLADAMAQEIPIDPAALVYDAEQLRKLDEARSGGASVVLESRLPKAWTLAIARHLGFAAPDAEQAAVTAETARAIPADIPAAKRPSLFRTLRIYAKAMRVEQWSKNVLVFAPAVLAHRLDEAHTFFASVIAFFCLSLVASSIYLLNDTMDLKQDRRHPVKRNRPFASGALPVSHGLVLMPALLATAVGLSLFLPPLFLGIIGAYVALNFAYTFYLKRRLMVDVLALAASYTLRILAGNVATTIELSFWLLALSMFLFLSLALVKRYVELDTVSIEAPDEKRVMGRGYRYSDIDMLSQIGVSSGFSAVLVLALYVDRSGRAGLYKTPELIWLICPLLLYVIARIWVLAKRRELPDDPVHFLIRDWRSHLIGVLVIAVMLLATWI
jgi:4-hydroxybenzoate polyprenyltransferase